MTELVPFIIDTGLYRKKLDIDLQAARTQIVPKREQSFTPYQMFVLTTNMDRILMDLGIDEADNFHIVTEGLIDGEIQPVKVVVRHIGKDTDDVMMVSSELLDAATQMVRDTIQSNLALVFDFDQSQLLLTNDQIGELMRRLSEEFNVTRFSDENPHFMANTEVSEFILNPNNRCVYADLSATDYAYTQHRIEKFVFTQLTMAR